MDELLQAAGQYARSYVAGLGQRSVAPDHGALDALSLLGGPLANESDDPLAVLELLHRVGSPATVASAGPRYFGFVIGGTLPVALGAGWLGAAWDQNAAYTIMSPVAARIEEIVTGWTLELLGLPDCSAVGFVTGATMGNFTALAAARHSLLARQGWDVEADGLFGAPPITVVVGEEVHVSLMKSLVLLGLGRQRVVRAPVDNQGRMLIGSLPRLDEHTVLCLQVGNVNSGASDPCEPLCLAARQAGAWVHVDGAFGLWLAASENTRPLVAGVELADSWSTDAHKWLNVSYDSGLAICRDAGALSAAMAASGAAYLQSGEAREAEHYVPEMSRRARGIELWAAMRTLGLHGVARLVDDTCRLARRFADALSDAGFVILNDVVSNQVVVSFGPGTPEVIAAVQAEGTCWCGGTMWHGQPAMRISVSSWRTRNDDVDVSVRAITQIARSFE